MEELNKFVAHIRNLKEQGVKQATFDVEYLERLFEYVNPTRQTIKRIKAEQNIVNDGGRFFDE